MAQTVTKVSHVSAFGNTMSTILRCGAFLSALACALLALLVVSDLSLAAVAKAHWRVQSESIPTNFTAERCPNNPEQSENELTAVGCDVLALRVTNVGSKTASGGVSVIDTVPQGLRIVTAEREGIIVTAIPAESLLTGEKFPCTVSGPTSAPYGGTVECSNVAEVRAEDVLLVKIAVEVKAPGPAVLEDNEATVTGSGLNEETAKSPVDIEQSHPFRIEGFSLQMRDIGGEPSIQAGEHPSLLTTDLEFPSLPSQLGASERTQVPATAVEFLKDAFVYLPLGMAGNPQVMPRCPAVTLVGTLASCPLSSRVGTVTWNSGGVIQSSLQNSPYSSNTFSPGYIYNLIPEAGYAAEFGFYYLGKAVVLPATVVRLGGPGGGYALRVGATGIPKFGGDPITSLTLSFFGTPSARNGGGGSSEAFLTNPTNCAGPLSAKTVVDTWEDPGAWLEQETVAYQSVIGCNGLTFSPRLAIRPEVSTADTPAGYEAVLRLPQNKNTSPAIAVAQLKDAKVVLPSGVSLSPSAANGLVGCAADGPQGINIGSSVVGPAGEDLGNPNATELGDGYPGGGNGSIYDDGIYHTAAGHCPGASQIGTVEVKTPLLSEPLTGHIFVAKPECGPCTDADAVDGKLYGIYLEASGSGVIIKLHGEVSANPATGQLTATFNENPQFPFEEFRLKFDGGPGAALANPQTCGSFGVESDMTPWSTPQTPDATPQDTFSITGGANGGKCVSSEAEEPNSPSFEAGTTNPLAGTFSPFVLRVKREDGSQRLERINATLPPGLLGKLAGITYCSDAQIASASTRSGQEEISSPSCPSTSEVGTVTVGAGPGTKPYYVHGHAYLSGPYKGAPLSLVIITPAVAGPFDLGNVAVRTALYVNEQTAQITAKSDPIPRILDGTPLDVRSITLELKRNQFTLNPTDCEAMSITGEAISAAGQTAMLNNRFQVGGCGALGFKPKIAISLKGQTKRTGHPALTATVTYPKKGAYANIARAQVSLPHSEFLDQNNFGDSCTRPVLAAHACPPKSIYGKAKAWSPLLEKPLEGNVYLVGGYGYKLPALVAELNGQIRVLLVGKVDTGKNGGIRNTFEAVPDAPVSRFVLQLKGGKRYGLLINSEDLCKKKQKAQVSFTAQNGRKLNLQPKISNTCGSKPHHK